MIHRLLSKAFLFILMVIIAICPATGLAQIIQTNIGDLTPEGVVTSVSGGFDVSAGGSDIGGNNDQFAFNYQAVTGDFDYKLRIGGLTQADTWTKAGLMARATLTTNSAFAAALATPSSAGAYFSTRTSAGANTTNVGSFPVNYPNTWLRLQRTNNLFSSFASLDGNNWVRLGDLTITMPGTVFVGMAVASRTNGTATVAQFRDFQSVTNGEVVPYSPQVEPPGPSSRLTPFAVTEIMYNPAPNANSNILEFVEVYNSNPFIEEIGGYRLSGEIDYTFPEDMMIEGGSYVVIARDPVAVQNAYGITGVFGPYTNALTGTGTLRLRNKENAVLLEIPYTSQPPWPAGADGAGHSLVLARPSYGERDSFAWAISDKVGGSPGGFDPQSFSPQRAVVINEFFANSEAPDVDFIELYNHSNQSVDVSGCTLSDDPHTNKFVIPAGTSIPARGFIVFYQGDIGFGLSSGGETIYFRSADNSRVLDSIRYEAQGTGVSSGRYPNGAEEFYPMQSRTPAAANEGISVHDVVINEIMYRPVTGNDDDEFIELYNKGTNTVSLAGWRFIAGINYTFPSSAVIAPDSYLVVAANVTRMIANHPNLNPNNTYGNFNGSLRNRGERVALAMPDIDISTNNLGVVRTNTVYVVVDELYYRAGGNWPKWANEGGSSLELIDPRSNHRLAQNWADSDETQKAPWTIVEATGNMDHGSPSDPADWAEILPMNDGEYLVDDYEIYHDGGTTNFLTTANSTFENGLGNWFFRGTVGRSFLENSGGFGGGRCLHLVASARGDTMYNRALCKPIPSVPRTGSVTLRAKVRWLRGWPEMLLRLKGNWMEAYGRLNLPSNLGTPGLPNSAAAPNAAPAIYAVKHAPVVPAASEAVVVTARAEDPDGLQSLVLKYRIDPSTSYISVNMKDDGTGGDAVAGDGLYSGTIPGQASGVMVAFQVTGSDSLGAERLFPNQYPYWTRPFECLVRFGDPVISSSFATYRQWMSQATVAAFTARPALDNERLFETLVYGNFRAFYNVSMKWAGSPYHQFSGSPVTTAAHYAIDLPADDLFLGTDGLNKIHSPGNSPFDDATAQREQFCYWMARQMGLPWNYRRSVNMFFNGNRRGGTTSLMEDTMTPGDDVVDAYFPDDNDGNLYKFQPWFEQGDPTSGANNRRWASFTKFATISNGVPIHKTAAYRHNFLVRAANVTANDFGPVFELIDAAQSTSNLTVMAENLSSIANMEQWFRTFAVTHAVGDWDHFGYRNSQNMYGYKPKNGKWSLMIWDMNIVLGNSGSDGANTLTLNGNLTSVNSQDRVMPFLYSNPPFRRMYIRALKELCTSVWATNKYIPVIDAKYGAMLASGVTPSNPDPTIKSYIATARTTILNSISAEDANEFLITSSDTVDTADNFVVISGQAPVEASTIKVNGIEYFITWTSAKNFLITVPVAPGNTVLSLQGIDLKGHTLAGFTGTVTVNSTAQVPPPESSIVINEIMFNPIVPDAEYVELYNKSVHAYDLSGWQFNGLDYTFPEGSIITNGQYLLLVKDRGAFIRAYGATIPVFDQFDGNLQSAGETITLIKPGATPALDVVIDKVRYESVLPWPLGTNGIPTASSIQLVDVTQDNSRPLNWSTRYDPAVYGTETVFLGATNAGWRRGVFTGAIAGPPSTPGTNFFLFLNGAGDVYVDDLVLVAGTEPDVGENLLQNGDFESPLSPAWITQGNHGASDVDNTFSRSGSSSLRIVSTGPGSLSSNIKQFIPSPSSNLAPHTLSYWFYSTTNANGLIIRTTPGSLFVAGTNVQPEIIPPFYLPPPLLRPAVMQPTPGSNNIDTASLAPIPPLWLNELQPGNTVGITDNMGEREPWIELHNAGTNTLTLDSYFLANNYDSNLTQWAFPAGSTIAPGQFKIIWADGEPGETTATHLHTSFRLSATNGTVALVRLQDGKPQVLDYLTYSGIGSDLTYGDYPDGQPFNRVTMRDATPGGTNIARPFILYINEWLAGNTNTIADPADGQFEDWFEVYNPGTNSVDLGGLWFGDNTNDRYQVPTNGQYQISAGGYLLVWADNEPDQNNAQRPDLHVNFQLSKAGDSITLYASDRSTIIDTVSFTNQVDDIGQGRYPDGSLDIRFLTNTTPRTANSLIGGNTPPLLEIIPDRTVRLGQTVSFIASATDAQAPPQLLSYELLPAIPAGASIDAATGQFIWTPAENQAPSTNTLTVRASDNGVPVQSASRSFVITVLLPPQATISIDGSGDVLLGFATTPGRTYRIEYKDSLSHLEWSILGNPILASSSTLSVPDNIGANPQRFYRIVQLD